MEDNLRRCERCGETFISVYPDPYCQFCIEQLEAAEHGDRTLPLDATPLYFDGEENEDGY